MWTWGNEASLFCSLVYVDDFTCLLSPVLLADQLVGKYRPHWSVSWAVIEKLPSFTDRASCAEYILSLLISFLFFIFQFTLFFFIFFIGSAFFS